MVTRATRAGAVVALTRIAKSALWSSLPSFWCSIGWLRLSNFQATQIERGSHHDHKFNLNVMDRSEDFLLTSPLRDQIAFPAEIFMCDVKLSDR
jgi:hypothetical protein